MISYPNAKINLGLEVLSKRKDGLHNINSFFLPINLSDVLEVKIDSSLNDKILISYSGFLFNDSENDLVLKAYNILSKDFDLGSVRIHLHKNIPFGSGLGGGSSNASFMLLSLNKLFNLGLDLSSLLKYANFLGSDCSFFLYNSLSKVTKNGSVITPLNLNLSNYYLILIKADCNISTSHIFANYQCKPKSNKRMILDSDISTWKNNLTNDLELVTFSLFPELADIKNYLYSIGAIFSSMTGSGSCVYGVFDKKPIQKVRYKNFWIWEGYI
tara:strand:+ start:534 stop:1346 length:813 start_codon:yes stop_codon:yes gene_type:complete